MLIEVARGMKENVLMREGLQISIFVKVEDGWEGNVESSRLAAKLVLAPEFE